MRRCALERLVVIKFPRVNPKLFHLYVFTYKIDLFSYCRIFTNSFPFASSRISTMFYSQSLTTFVYSPVRNSSSFSRTRLAAPAREPNRPILILTSRLEINSVCEWPGNAMLEEKARQSRRSRSSVVNTPA